MKMKTYEPKYWCKKGKYQREYDMLYGLLVPDSGEANTEQGELLRMTSRLYYEIYNNGRNCNSRKEEITYLNKHKKKFGFEKYISRKLSDEDMDLLVDKVIEHILYSLKKERGK